MSDNETETDRRMLEALVCPLTQAVLTYDAEAHELISKAAHLAYPIRRHPGDAGVRSAQHRLKPIRSAGQPKASATPLAALPPAA